MISSHLMTNGSEAFDGKVKKLVLIGATREKIAETAARLGFTDIVMADTFEEAFEKCVGICTARGCGAPFACMRELGNV